MAYRELYTCKNCERIFHDACLTCGWAFREQKIICPNCHSTEKPEKRKYFICPSCFEPVIEESRLKNTAYDLSGHKYCTNCGHEIGSVLQKERQEVRGEVKSREEGGQEYQDKARACLELANNTQEGHYEPTEHELCDVMQSLQAMCAGTGEYPGGGKDGRNKK